MKIKTFTGLKILVREKDTKEIDCILEKKPKFLLTCDSCGGHKFELEVITKSIFTISSDRNILITNIVDEDISIIKIKECAICKGKEFFEDKFEENLNNSIDIAGT